MTSGRMHFAQVASAAVAVTAAASYSYVRWRCNPQHSSSASSREVLVVHPAGNPYSDWASALRLYLQKRYHLNVRTKVFDREDFDHDPGQGVPKRVLDPSCVILPMQVDVTRMLAECGVDNALVCVNDPDIYVRLDDKAEMAQLDFGGNFLPQIPTFDLGGSASAAGLQRFLAEDQTGCARFILKPSRGAGSEDQTTITREEASQTLVRLLRAKRWKNEAVLQPFMAEHSTIEFNFLAIGGQMVDWICTWSPGGLAEGWDKGIELETYEEPDLDRIVAFVREAVEQHNLQGLMEIEFLKLPRGNQPGHEDLYLLEVNPRISSSVVAFDADGNSPYIERLIIPYLQHFCLLRDRDQAVTCTCPTHLRPRKFHFPPQTTATHFWLSHFGGSSGGRGIDAIQERQSPGLEWLIY